MHTEKEVFEEVVVRVIVFPEHRAVLNWEDMLELERTIQNFRAPGVGDELLEDFEEAGWPPREIYRTCISTFDRALRWGHDRWPYGTRAIGPSEVTE